jgi:4-amino-4-deoxy-L-arabinose transferase-like glycosyltransferase
LLLLLAFWWLSLRHLEVTPPAHEDEAWIASVGWKLARAGVFGSDQMRGLFGMEAHYASMPPLHPLLLGAAFRLLGAGLWQSRWVSAAQALLVLALTYALGRRLFGRGVGGLAAGGLALISTAGLTRSLSTGILLADLARMGRYDLGTALFGLAALHAWLSARRRAGGWRLRLVGGLAGLAMLSHFYGGVWLLVLIALCGLAWPGAGRGAAVVIAGAFAVVLTPYVVWVALHAADWRWQLAIYGDRFQFFSPAWYWHNLLAEPRRYAPGLGAPGWHYALRPGFWLAAAAIPGAALALARLALVRRVWTARVIVAPLVVFPVFLALFAAQKTPSFLMAFWPAAAVAAAWSVRQAWRWAARPDRRLWRWALAALLLAAVAEGAARLAAREQLAATTTPYRTYVGRVRAEALNLAPAPRVLGLHTYWLGFFDMDYLSWFVPINLAAPPPGVAVRPAADVLEALRPDVVLVDARMRAYLDSAGGGALPVQITDWLNEHYALSAVVADATYGRMDVYGRRLVE